MARYSSDSDSDYRYRRRRNRKSRSSSSDFSESSPHRKRSLKHVKTKHGHHSHSSRDRTSKNYRGSGSSHSRDRDKRRYHSSTGRSNSSDRTKRKLRSISREKSQSPLNSLQSNLKLDNVGKSQIVVEKDDFPIESCFKDGVIEEINADGFTPKQFISSTAIKANKFKNIIIDISSDTIQIPSVPNVLSGPESIFHTSITADQEQRFERWVKKLHTLRQKAIADLMNINVT